MQIPPPLRYANAPAKLRDWKIPARLDRKPLAIEGHFQFQPAPAGAWRARLTSDGQPLPGVRITLSPGTPPAVMLDNTSDAPITVLGARGEPFLRIGPQGVSVNLASPTWQDQNRYRGLAAELAPPGAERWQRVSPAPRYVWLEPRIRAGEWRVPLESAGRRGEIAGVLEWIAPGK
jgi:hypothetical protein